MDKKTITKQFMLEKKYYSKYYKIEPIYFDIVDDYHTYCNQNWLSTASITSFALFLGLGAYVCTKLPMKSGWSFLTISLPLIVLVLGISFFAWIFISRFVFYYIPFFIKDSDKIKSVKGYKEIHRLLINNREENNFKDMIEWLREATIYTTVVLSESDELDNLTVDWLWNRYLVEENKKNIKSKLGVKNVNPIDNPELYKITKQLEEQAQNSMLAIHDFINDMRQNYWSNQKHDALSVAKDLLNQGKTNTLLEKVDEVFVDGSITNLKYKGVIQMLDDLHKKDPEKANKLSEKLADNLCNLNIDNQYCVDEIEDEINNLKYYKKSVAP